MSRGYWSELQDLQQKYRSSGILLDTNVLLLWLSACYAPEMIGGKRLEKYDRNDGELLLRYVMQFQLVLTTPHILTETSNLAAQALSGRAKKDFFNLLYPLFCITGNEAFQLLRLDDMNVEQAPFVRLGLTDATLVSSNQKHGLLLTDDLDLFIETQSRGGPSINFTHMREAANLI